MMFYSVRPNIPLLHNLSPSKALTFVVIGIMIVFVGVKTRSIISARVANKEIRAEVKKLATWGAGMALFPFKYPKI